jgi:F-type H+-transporting ATPase subunit delta
MNNSLISVRYTKALFQSALDKNILDKVNQDMVFISGVLMDETAREFLKNPVIAPAKKMEIFHKMFGRSIEKVTMSLIDLLVKNGRESFLPAVARNFTHETLKYKGITRTVLTTATGLDEKVKKQLADLISEQFKTKVELEEAIDPEILGGFVLRIDDSYIDASVKSKLNKIRKELTGSAIIS